RNRSDQRERHREFAGRSRALRFELAKLLKVVNPSDLRFRLPLAYADPSAATGDVLLRWQRTRRFDPILDSPDVPRLEPVVLELPPALPEASRPAVAKLIADYLGGDWAHTWRTNVHP